MNPEKQDGNDPLAGPADGSREHETDIRPSERRLADNTPHESAGNEGAQPSGAGRRTPRPDDAHER